MLDERKKRILQAIIEDFINTAEPIGSRTIARKMNIGVSSATIRNEMADLEELGFLEQPYTSAGRKPSAKAYRFYVDCLLSPLNLSNHEVFLIKKWYNERANQLESIFAETVKILSHVTHNVSLMFTQQELNGTFNSIHFLPLDLHRVIMVVVGENGILENKIITVSKNLKVDDLQYIATVINNNFSGRKTTDISLEFIETIKKESILNSTFIDILLDELRLFGKKKKNKKLYSDGAAELINKPEFRDIRKLHCFMQLLEEENFMYDLLRNEVNDGIVITIGQENKFSAMNDCSIIQASFRINGETVGKIAVLGPTRMHYGKIISTLNFMTKYMIELIKHHSQS